MNLLALETSTEWLSLALSTDGSVVTHRQKAGQQASQLVLPQIQALLDKADLSLSQIDGIVFGAGPGAFTGVRIACGVAQGLGLGLSKPVVGVNVLEAMAASVDANHVIVAIDARMGEVYHAAYRREGGAWVAVCEAGVYQPDQLPSISGEHWVGIGSAWGLHEVSLNRQYRHNIVSMVTEVVPQASAMIQLAEPVFEKGDAKSANQARPIYIRNKVALTTKERELGLRL